MTTTKPGSRAAVLRSSERSEQLSTAFADKVFTAAFGTRETFNLYLGDRLGWLDALAEGAVRRREKGKRSAILGHLTLLSLSSVFTTCRAQLRCSPRSTTPSGLTA
jgi:hypothetical protein